MAIQLTKERYEKTANGELISWGVIENSPDGCFMDSDSTGRAMLLWGAWKGGGNDWAIYVAPLNGSTLLLPPFHDPLQAVHEHGNKVTDPRNVDRIIHADPEVNARYRR